MIIEEVRQKYPEAIHYSDEQLEVFCRIADIMAEITLKLAIDTNEKN